MIETLLSMLEEFWRNFRPSDAVDILLMSVILYSVLLWFKETASRRVLIGVSLMLIIYFSARAFDMYLTSLVFHTGFAVLVIVMIVVFQEDLRRMFERVAAWAAIRRHFRQNHDLLIDADAVVEAAFNLASSKTGALIVIKGSEPLDRHLDGGIPLGGHISKPLFYSIFDSSSPGHDGAVIIERDRISRFAAHLPISKNHKEISGRGTRHSAGLGLSELCDALVIVVSEERGEVSVAESGRLRKMSSAADLMNHIERFHADNFPETDAAVWQKFVTKHWPLKIFALMLTIVAWFVLAYNPSTVQRTFVVPIEYRNLSSDMQLDKDAPNEARVTLSGSEGNFRFLEPSTLTISIDLGNIQSYDEQAITITEENIRLPANLQMYRIEPHTIRLDFRKPEAPSDKASP
jgi:diadenylate cyclase